MRTLSPARVASKPSIRTSSSSSSSSLRGRWPPGRTLVESCSWGRGPCCGLGLIVSLDEAEPARRIPGRGGSGDAGLVGSGLGVGSGGGFGAARVSGLAAGLRLFGGGRLATRAAGRSAARARGAWPRARDGFFDGRLEELTPKLPDPPDGISRGAQSYDGRLSGLRQPLQGGVGHSLAMNPNDAVGAAAFLNDTRSHGAAPFLPACAGDLQLGGDDVAPAEPRQSDPRAPNLRLHTF